MTNIDAFCRANRHAECMAPHCACACHTVNAMHFTPEEAEKMLHELHEYLDAAEALHKKTNDELGEMLVDHVWAYMPWGPKSWLVDEVIDRLVSQETRDRWDSEESENAAKKQT